MTDTNNNNNNKQQKMGQVTRGEIQDRKQHTKQKPASGMSPEVKHEIENNTQNKNQ